MGVNHPAETTTLALPDFGFRQQIIVLAEKNPSEFTRTVEEAVVSS